MQGKKEYQEKLFAGFQLSERIPKDNFYRRLKVASDLDFLYPLTKGGKSTGKVHEGQTAEYDGNCFRHPDPVHGPTEDKYHRDRAGQQVHAPSGHRLQPEEVPEIRRETGKKWGGATCFVHFAEKRTYFPLWTS